jgi:D-serine deaminase-like pyridoxal phosphate-dependent protein
MSPLPIPPQTPSLVIDHAALMANLTMMQAACDAAGVRLRAHGKMHKCSALGRLQVELGAVGLCCQTIGEAEAYAAAGIGDLLISAPLPFWGRKRAAALAQTCKLSVVCDSVTQIARLGEAAVIAGVEIGCLIDVNIGMHRVGCSVDEAPVLAGLAVARDGLRYEGVQAYFGHLQHLEGRAMANAEGTTILAELIHTLGEMGLAPPIVTGGGTGTYALDLAAGVFTELQCGSYALMDCEYGDCGGPDGDWPFKPALFIAATVISAKHKSHVTIDVGLKATSMDVAPRVVAGAPAGSLWRSLGDEHGAILHPAILHHMKGGADAAAVDSDPAIAWPADAPQEGDTIWLQPGHCDPTINLYDAFFVAMGDGRLDRWPIDARRVSA